MVIFLPLRLPTATGARNTSLTLTMAVASLAIAGMVAALSFSTVPSRMNGASWTVSANLRDFVVAMAGSFLPGSAAHG